MENFQCRAPKLEIVWKDSSLQKECGTVIQIALI